MFDNLETANVVESSEEDLLAALGDTGDSGKAKKTDSKKSAGKSAESKSESSSTEKKDKTETKEENKTVSEFSEDDLAIALGEKEDDDSENENENADDSENDGSDEDDNEEDKDEAEEDETDDKDKDASFEIKSFLKSRVDFLIKSGEWVDFEDRDNIEWDEETFADAELQQREHQKQVIKNELLSSFGPYGSRIAEHSANGGDPDKLIDLFKEQQKVVSLSVETDEAQKSVILKHAKEFLGMKDAQAQRHLNAIIADNSLKDEAVDAKSQMEASIKEQAENLEAEAEAEKLALERSREEAIQKTSEQTTALINSRDDIPADEKRDLIKLLTKFDKKLPNGTKVNEFYFKFAEARKDLPRWLEVVRHILDPEKYKKSIQIDERNAANDKAFKLIRKGQETKKTKTAGVDSGSNKSTKKPTTGFKLLY